MESESVNKFVNEFLRERGIDYFKVIDYDCAVDTHVEAEIGARHFVACGGSLECQNEVYGCILDGLRVSRIARMEGEIQRLTECVQKKEKELRKAMAQIRERKVVVMENELLHALDRIRSDQQRFEEQQTMSRAGKEAEKVNTDLNNARKREMLFIDFMDWSLKKYLKTVA